MLERDSREDGDQKLLEAPRSESAPVRERSQPYGPPADEADRLRAPARRERPFEADEDREPQDRSADGEAHKSWLRRHPIAVALGLLCLLLALPAGYLYWDYASHFETTDDAYIAARQFAIAPKVSGYITAVPVTDNEHVTAGGVIARIDERDYRIALAQAQAQVAGAEANIENIDAQIDVQQAQINADQAQVERVQAALVFAQQQAARYQYLAQTRLAGSVQNAQQYTSQLHQQQAAARERAGDAQAGAAANRGAEGATRQRRREPGASQSPARPGATEPLLYDRHGRPAGRVVQPHRRGRPISHSRAQT